MLLYYHVCCFCSRSFYVLCTLLQLLYSNIKIFITVNIIKYMQNRIKRWNFLELCFYFFYFFFFPLSLTLSILLFLWMKTGPFHSVWLTRKRVRNKRAGSGSTIWINGLHVCNIQVILWIKAGSVKCQVYDENDELLTMAILSKQIPIPGCIILWCNILV